LRALTSAALQAASVLSFRLNPGRCPGLLRKGGPLGLIPASRRNPDSRAGATRPEGIAALRANGPGALSPAQRAGLRSIRAILRGPTGSDNRRRSVPDIGPAQGVCVKQINLQGSTPFLLSNTQGPSAQRTSWNRSTSQNREGFQAEFATEVHLQIVSIDDDVRLVDREAGLPWRAHSRHTTDTQQFC